MIVVILEVLVWEVSRETQDYQAETGKPDSLAHWGHLVWTSIYTAFGLRFLRISLFIGLPGQRGTPGVPGTALAGIKGDAGQPGAPGLPGQYGAKGDRGEKNT